MDVNKRLILDSNIIIYTGLVEHGQLRKWLKSKKIVVSLISQLEVLGYPKLVLKEKRYFEEFFEQCDNILINHQIIHVAIHLRQQKRMSLGDAIIAATALTEKLPLVTANIKDFQHIQDLELIDPLRV